MININDKHNCSGCKACSNICPVKAITYAYDEEGFYYPTVDRSICINCGRCDSVCPYNDKNHGVSELNLREVSIYYAAQLKNTQELHCVSSGGAFQALAQTVIKEGGIVYGVAQENVDNIFHIRVSNQSDLKRTRRSKYFQSDIGECLQGVQKDLKEGKIVLFSGTGCQIAGLNRFLNNRYESLYTCEVVCHGIPSKKVWQIYRKEKEEREKKKIKEIVFRDKSAGWSNNQYKITYEDGSVEFERSSKQLFHAGYLKGLFYRPSCGKCPFASMPRTADITLADFWKYKGEMRAGNMGVSLVVINNHHGKELFSRASDLLNIESIPQEDAFASCKHLDEHPTENRYREIFLQKVFSDGYYSTAKKYINSNSLVRRIRKAIRTIIGRKK